MASGSAPPGSVMAAGSGPPGDSCCSNCSLNMVVTYMTNCSHNFCETCILPKLQQDDSLAMQYCLVCECPITFLLPSEANSPLPELIARYNLHFADDIRTLVHQKVNSTVSSERKGKTFPKLIDIKWKITNTHESGDSTSRFCRLIKPDGANNVQLANKDLPPVMLNVEQKYDGHAFKIMHQLNHKNLVHVLAAGHNKIAGSFDTFIEKTSGNLISLFPCIDQLVDDIWNIPSPKLQSVVREIVTTLAFLRDHSLYHGDLSWITTLYAHPHTVKLSGFTSQGLMTLVEAQMNDLRCLAAMLREIRDTASNFRNKRVQIFFCHIDGLIRVLEGPFEKLQHEATSIVDHTFFWDEGKRINFYVNVVSVRLKDELFEFMIHHFNICAESWITSNVADFVSLVQSMNKYREKKGLPIYDTQSKVDFLRCVCGAYTHRHELKQIQVDKIICNSQPALSIFMKRLVETFDRTGYQCDDRQCSICRTLRGYLARWLIVITHLLPFQLLNHQHYCEMGYFSLTTPLLLVTGGGGGDSKQWKGVNPGGRERRRHDSGRGGVIPGGGGPIPTAAA